MKNIEKIIIDNMLEGMLQIDGHGNIIFANTAALSILELNNADVIGNKFGPMFLDSEYNDDFVQVILDAFMLPEKTHQGVVTLKVRDKIKYLKSVARSEILTGSGNEHTLLTTVCFQDISDYIRKRRLEEEILKLNKTNRTLDIRNKLIRKIFGSFILRDEDADSFMTVEHMKELNRGIYKKVAVIQSDLRGYTAMSFALAPDDLITIMNYYISQMSDVILSHHGMIVEILGDGIVSAFGTLGHEETRCEDAIAAAVEMQQKMPEINAWIKDHRYDTYLKMGIGIDEGTVIIGFVGNEDLRAFDVMGEVIGTADKIQSNTIEGDILISERIRANNSADLEIGKNLQVNVNGKDEQAFQVKAIGQPYNLKCPVVKSDRKTLKEAAKGKFYIINGKIRENAEKDCSIIELSDNEMSIKCSYDLKVLTNIMMDIGGSLYGKIIEKNQEDYVISFTSTPTAFAEWKKNLLE